MKMKLYFEDENSSMGGWEIISITKFIWRMFLGKIKPKEKFTTYFIRRVETINGKRI